MITTGEKRILQAKLEQYEGRVNHMYLCSRGFVTIGVGHLLSDVAEAQKLKMEDSKNMPAKMSDIRADFESVRQQPANRVAPFYKRHTKLVLPATEIDSLLNKHIDSFERELRILYSGFDQFPSEVKLALFDLIFNVGMTDLSQKWPFFNAAIRARDWQKAANQSNRKAPISMERNRYVKDLLERATAAVPAHATRP